MRVPAISNRSQRGVSLIELVVVIAILLTLTAIAMPLAQVTAKREQEIELRRALRQMRSAIDAYKKMADQGLIELQVGSEGYPPDLETLVEGIYPVGQVNKVRFLRRIPFDPMTKSQQWGLRAYQDDPDAKSWSGQNVYDVFTRSGGVALDATRYRDW
jgi:general secretion pathway protein G